MFFKSPNPFAGPFGNIQVVTNELLGDPYEDWSQVRSPSRAARRRKRGFPQRIFVRYKANGKCFHDKVRNVIYMHPDDQRRLDVRMKDRVGG